VFSPDEVAFDAEKSLAKMLLLETVRIVKDS